MHQRCSVLLPVRSITFVRFALLLLFSVLAVGCASGEKRTFSLEVRNTSTKPITVGLAKNGPPMEIDWESPADRAIMDPKNTGIGWGNVIPPGKTATMANLAGTFSPQTSAFLRVYVGDLPLNDILAIGPESRNRIDVRLREGRTTLVVVDRGPFIDVTITSYEPTGEEAKRRPPPPSR